jgi:hypothetical protein
MSRESNTLQKEAVTRFFQNLEARAWTDAEKELDSIRQNIQNNPWNKGYVKALEGLLLTFRNPEDKYIFLPKILANPTENNIHNLKKEFDEFASNELHGEYDRGYFKALEEYLTSVTLDKSVALASKNELPTSKINDNNITFKPSSEPNVKDSDPLE